MLFNCENIENSILGASNSSEHLLQDKVIDATNENKILSKDINENDIDSKNKETESDKGKDIESI